MILEFKKLKDKVGITTIQTDCIKYLNDYFTQKILDIMDDAIIVANLSKRRRITLNDILMVIYIKNSINLYPEIPTNIKYKGNISKIARQNIEDRSLSKDVIPFLYWYIHDLAEKLINNAFIICKHSNKLKLTILDLQLAQKMNYL